MQMKWYNVGKQLETFCIIYASIILEKNKSSFVNNQKLLLIYSVCNSDF